MCVLEKMLWLSFLLCGRKDSFVIVEGPFFLVDSFLAIHGFGFSVGCGLDVSKGCSLEGAILEIIFR